MNIAPHLHRSRKSLSPFERFAATAMNASGHSRTFGLACAVVVGWLIAGPFFGYSEKWQLLINTGTTIVTFLMVFPVQQTQNKDSVAVHLKLNELIASHMQASNRLIAVEDLSEDDLRLLHAFYAHLAELAEKEGGVKHTHSLDEAGESHARKHQRHART